MRIARIFLMFLWRDATIYWKRKYTYLINYTVIYSALYSFAFLFMGSQVFFTSNNSMSGTTMFLGNILMTLMTLTYKLTIDLLFDLEQDRFIDYQITLLPPRYVLLARIVFVSLFTFILLAPYFPLAKILFSNHFDTSNTSWIALEGMVLLGAVFCTAYHLMVSVATKSSANITQFWVRLNQPLLILGGFWIPRATIEQFSPLLGFLCYFNPFMYITEGLRYAALGGTQFLPLSICVPILLVGTFLATMLCCYFFKQRTDHI